jgi:hypothetical protein
MSHSYIRQFRGLPPVRAIKAFFRAPRAAIATTRERRIRRQSPAHELAIAAIFKNEANNLAEWLIFHHGIGVSQFYLYNNNSTDDYEKVLHPWIAMGVVTLTEWPTIPGQRSAYMHCVQTRWREAKWIAFIDLDEFLFSPQQRDIRPILQKYADEPALYVYSLRFGSSGHVMRPDMPVVEAYLRREPLGRAATGKSIVNPRFVRSIPNAHHFGLWRGRTVNTRLKPTDSPRDGFEPDAPPVYDVLRINHYFYKSRTDLIDKAVRGDAFYGLPRDFVREVQGDSIANSDEDQTILPLWRAIVREDRIDNFDGCDANPA